MHWLKYNCTDAELDSWDFELAESAEFVARGRATYFGAWAVLVSEILSKYLPELGQPSLCYQAGWNDSETLLSTLISCRSRDRMRGLLDEGHIAAIGVCILNMLRRVSNCLAVKKTLRDRLHAGAGGIIQSQSGGVAIVVLDDLSSELDSQHQQVVLETLLARSAQVLLTATESMKALDSVGVLVHRFHVEQGQVEALL